MAFPLTPSMLLVAFQLKQHLIGFVLHDACLFDSSGRRCILPQNKSNINSIIVHMQPRIQLPGNVPGDAHSSVVNM